MVWKLVFIYSDSNFQFFISVTFYEYIFRNLNLLSSVGVKRRKGGKGLFLREIIRGKSSFKAITFVPAKVC